MSSKIEKEHILQVLKEVKTAVKENNILKIKELSNKTIHSASIFQDEDNIMLAVILYSLAKIIERTNYKNYKSWPSFFNAFMEHIDKAISSLSKDNLEIFENELSLISKEINSLSGSFKRSIQDVFQRARINKASRLYEHGVSLGKTASLLGITLFELSEYTGETGISEVDLNITMPIKKRVKNAMEMFE